MTVPTAAQIALGIVPVVVAWIAYRQAVRAAKLTADQADRAARQQHELERARVDADAYNRAKAIYEAALEQLQKQLDRVQANCERLTEQLSRERDTSRALRAQVAELQEQITTMEQTMTVLRGQLIALGDTPGDGELPEPEPT